MLFVLRQDYDLNVIPERFEPNLHSKGRNNSFGLEFRLAPSRVILSETQFLRKTNKNHQNEIKMFTSCFAEQFIKSAWNDHQRKPFRAAKSLFSLAWCPFFLNLLNPQMSVSACGRKRSSSMNSTHLQPPSFSLSSFEWILRVASCYCRNTFVQGRSPLYLPWMADKWTRDDTQPCHGTELRNSKKYFSLMPFGTPVARFFSATLCLSLWATSPFVAEKLAHWASKM